MPALTMHREDIKSELRKRFGSVSAFERQHRLPAKSVCDVFRGRRSSRVETAIVKALNDAPTSNDTVVLSGSKTPPQDVDNYALIPSRSNMR